jgi:hypothetical protein
VPFVDAARLSGTLYSGKSCEFDLGFGELEGVVKFSGTQSRKRKLVYGSRRDGLPIGFTAGKYTPPELEFTVLAATGQLILEQQAAAGNGSVGDAVQIITVSLYEPDITTAGTITLSFPNCVTTDIKFDGYDEDSEETYTVLTYATLGVTQSADGGATPLVLYSVQRSV